MDLIKYPKGAEEGKDGLHLPATINQDTETLCGIFMAGVDSYPEEVEGEKPQCPNCINIAKELFKRYTKKQVTSW